MQGRYGGDVGEIWGSYRGASMESVTEAISMQTTPWISPTSPLYLPCISFRLVRASPTGAQRFRLGGLFVVPEPAGAEYETDYKWVLPKYSRP